MCDCRFQGSGTIYGVVLVLLLGVPVMAYGEEATATTGKKPTEIQQTSKRDTGPTISGFMNWAQRFGNRVGENISEAASKTATAIKEAASDNPKKSKSRSEDNP